MEKLSVGTEGQGLYIERNDGLKFKTGGNRCGNFSSENSGYSENNETNQKRQCLASRNVRIEWNISWKTYWVLILVELA